MKTLNRIKMLILGGLLFNLALAANSANNGPVTGTNSAANTTEKTIKDYFKFPQVLMPHAEEKKIQNKVEVIFTTDLSGKVNFVLAKTTDKELKQEIEKQFYALQLPQLKNNVAHSVVLNFRTL